MWCDGTQHANEGAVISRYRAMRECVLRVRGSWDLRWAEMHVHCCRPCGAYARHGRVFCAPQLLLLLNRTDRTGQASLERLSARVVKRSPSFLLRHGCMGNIPQI